jgi:hypothetical protein
VPHEQQERTCFKVVIMSVTDLDVLQNSGKAWVDRFPTSRSVADLEPDFRARVERFLDALTTAGVEIGITATRRPRQRGYLMHYAWSIVRGVVDPAHVPHFVPEPGEESVPIRWLHLDADQTPNRDQSIAGAREMVEGYEITHLGVAPSTRSLHFSGQAIDMILSWQGDLTIADARGDVITISSDPRDGTNADLIRVGATYDVHHLVAVDADAPHWSVNGH